MEAWARTPTPSGRARRLMAVAGVAGCWLAVPSGAAAQAPALDASALTQQVTAAATTTVANTGAAVEDAVTAAAPLAGPAEDTVTQIAGTVARATGPTGPVARVGTSTAAATGSVAKRVNTAAAPVAGAADRLSREVRPAVDSAVHGVPGTERSAGLHKRPADGVAATGSPRVERLGSSAATGDTSRAGHLTLSHPDRAERPGLAGERSPEALPARAPVLPHFTFGPGVAMELAGADSDGVGPSAAAAGAAQDLPSAPEPLSGAGGGSSAAAASTSFVFGGMALLLAALCLAAPALRRRLPRRPVIGWPAAFVPLLERPG